MRLAVRLPLLGVSAVLVTGLASASIGVSLATSAARQSVGAATTAGAEAFARTVELFVDQGRREVLSLAADPALRGPWGTPPTRLAPPDRALSARAAIDRSLARFDGFESISLIHPDGLIYAVEPHEYQARLSRPDLGFTPWFAQALASDAAVVSDVHISSLTQRPTVVIAAAARQPGGEVAGVVAAALRLVDFSSLGGQPAGDFFGYLTDRHGLVVAHGRNPRLAEEQTDFSSVEAVRHALAGHSGVVEGVNVVEGEHRIASYLPLPELGWAVVYAVPTRIAYAPVGQLAWSTGLATIGLVGLVGFTSILVAGRTLRPIGRLARTATAISAGRVDVVMPAGGSDEVGTLTNHFNRMVGDLGERADELRKQATSLQAANAEIETMAYTLAHDLRAPLRAIDGFCARLAARMDRDDTEGVRLLQVVRHNTQQMSELIDDLLEHANLGRKPTEPMPVHPAAVARAAYAEIAPDPGLREVDFIVDEMPLAHADPRLLGRLYANLLSNALKFTRGRARARIHVGFVADDPLPPAYFVRDNGIGLDMTRAEDIFGMFNRLVRHDEFEGTGIGLAIVRRIAELHGGRAWVESVPGEGSTFYFTLQEGRQT